MEPPAGVRELVITEEEKVPSLSRLCLTAPNLRHNVLHHDAARYSLFPIHPVTTQAALPHIGLGS